MNQTPVAGCLGRTPGVMLSVGVLPESRERFLGASKTVKKARRAVWVSFSLANSSIVIGNTDFSAIA